MLVENPLGWTTMFPALIGALERPGVTALHIRMRCRMFIDQWGGLAAFGQGATDRLQSDLRRVDMRMAFRRPHVAAAARALRQVAGELRRAGMIQSREIPFLLNLMAYPAPAQPLLAPVERPQFLPRPVLDKSIWKTEEKSRIWVQAVTSDVVPLTVPGETMIAEITTFEIHETNRASYRLERIRAAFLDVGDRNGLAEWSRLLPQALWVDGLRATTEQPARTIVRRLSVGLAPQVPAYQLVLCPHWLERLGWRSHPDNWLVYQNHDGQVVARLVWWRDGGPVDFGDDAIWGEGVYVVVTAAGMAQIEALAGVLPMNVYARRYVRPMATDVEFVERSASSTT